MGPGIKTGLKLAVDNPAQQGSDLVVAAVAAVHDYPTPQILIDMGTATTVSVIDRSGAFIGKMILPGVMVSLDALSSHWKQHGGLYEERDSLRQCRSSGRAH